MDGLAIADLKGVVARVNFTEKMAEKLYSYNYEPPPGVLPRNTREEAHEVKILDGREVNDRLSLDREGFVLLQRPPRQPISMTTPGSPRSTTRMRAGDPRGRPARRGSSPSTTSRAMPRCRPGRSIKLPASCAQRLYRLVGAAAGARPVRARKPRNCWHRFAETCAQPIRGPLLRSPLAVRTQTLSEETSSPPELRYPGHRETAVTYNPAQRWFYLKMQADECVLIRCFDSARSGAARFSAHGAFDDPDSPPEAPPRESIEVRTLVFFAD
jgi:hypothetical protein